MSDLAFGLIRDEVVKITSSRQEPFVYGSLGGGIISLVPQPSQPISPDPIAGPSGASPPPSIGPSAALTQGAAPQRPNKTEQPAQSCGFTSGPCDRLRSTGSPPFR